MDRDREANNTRCTWFTQIGYVHGVEKFSLIVKGLHKYIGSSSPLVSSSKWFSTNDIRDYCGRMIPIYRREFLALFWHWHVSRCDWLLMLTRVALWLASDVDTCRVVIGLLVWGKTLLGLWRYNVDQCLVVLVLVKYGTNSAPLSSRVRETLRLGTCKI